MYDISVVVCCYNSSERIAATLDHLQSSELDGLSVEVIVVDNNCTDDTVAVAKALWARGDVAFKCVTESQPGLSYARKRGFDESSGEVILLVDDDNSLSPDYIRRMMNVFKKNPKVGIVGGVGELPPGLQVPSWFPQYQGRYALGPEDSASGSVGFVYGAGLAIRRCVLLELDKSGFKSQLSDRTAKSLTSGGDSEWCFAAKLLGWDVWRDSGARFVHCLPIDRYQEEYLIRLTKGIGESIPTLSIYTYFIRFRQSYLVLLVSLVAFLRSGINLGKWTLYRGAPSIVREERITYFSAVFKAWRVLLFNEYRQVLRNCAQVYSFNKRKV
jgi:glycosyltransferase involved in cell wall biosynthesis